MSATIKPATRTAVGGWRVGVRSGAGNPLALAAGACLAVAIAVIHVMDQGSLTTLKDPAYIGYGFRAVELAGVLAAVLLVARRCAPGWLLALGVAAGPLLGYVLTRSTGLPGATEDIGNWSEPIGLASLVSEVALLLLALASVRIDLVTAPTVDQTG